MKRKKQVVFLESYSTVMVYKIARLFKKKGYETILIRILRPPVSDKEFYKNGYDKVIDFNLDFIKLGPKRMHLIALFVIKNLKYLNPAFRQILKLRPHIFFGRANPNLPVAIFRILFRKTPFIYFPYDIRALWCPTPEIARKERGIPWFEIKAERFCFEHADGIMHKIDPHALKHLNGRMLGKNLKLPEHQIAFHAYCSKDFIIPFNKNKLSKKDKQMHLVCIASSGKKTKELYELYFNIAKYLIKQRIHFHIYINSNLASEKDEKKSFLEVYKDFPNIEYFHIHDSLDPRQIVKEISKYDFGFHNIESEIPPYDLDAKFSLGNRTSTFLEAGIPHIYPYYNDFLDKVMKKYGLGFTTSINGKNNISTIKRQIEKLNYKEIEKRIEKARKDFLMEKHFPRLEEFVRKVATTKKRGDSYQFRRIL